MSIHMTVHDMNDIFGIKIGASVGRHGIKRVWAIEIGLVVWGGIGK
jgi:hypothetical protein